MSNDPREGKLSSSYMEQADLCPGSWLAQRRALEIGLVSERDEPDAIEGRLLHSVMEGTAKMSSLNGEQTAAVQQAEREYATMRRSLGFKGDWSIKHPAGGEEREARVWVLNPDLTKMVSGQMDVFEIDGPKAIINDWKFGRLDVESASGNLQLMTTIVATFQAHFSIDEVYGVITQPFAEKSRRCNAVLYRKADQHAAYLRLRAICDRALDPLSSRNPSPKACRYCLVKALCPEANAATLAITSNKIEELSPKKIGELLYRFELAMKVIEAGKERAKAMLGKDKDAIPGWGLTSESKTVRITDVQKAYDVLKNFVHPDDILAAATISIDQIAERHRVRCEMPKSIARQQIEERLAASRLLDVSTNSPRLRKSL